MRTDDLLTASPEPAPGHPKIGIEPKITDAELITSAVTHALLGHTSEARGLRHTRAHLHHPFCYPPRAARLQQATAPPGRHDRPADRGTGPRHHAVDPDVWVADPTPVEYARSRDAVQRSEPAGWAEYRYCASRSRFFSGLRLHLLHTLHGLPVGFTLTGTTADENQTLLAIIATDPELTGPPRVGQVLIADKNYYGREFEATPTHAGMNSVRPAHKDEPQRTGTAFFTPLPQIIESINDTATGRLDLEHHGGHTPAGVCIRVARRIPALTAAIPHNDHTGQPIKHSLLAYDSQ